MNVVLVFPSCQTFHSLPSQLSLPKPEQRCVILARSSSLSHRYHTATFLRSLTISGSDNHDETVFDADSETFRSSVTSRFGITGPRTSSHGCMTHLHPAVTWILWCEDGTEDGRRGKAPPPGDIAVILWGGGRDIRGDLTGS